MLLTDFRGGGAGNRTWGSMGMLSLSSLHCVLILQRNGNSARVLVSPKQGIGSPSISDSDVVSFNNLRLSVIANVTVPKVCLSCVSN
jgi:hypothetical protein